MTKPQFNNVLLISGSGRNCGKTTLICNIISSMPKNSTIGLKISPHFHHTCEHQELIAVGDGYKIFKENDINSGKDSARMLASGAKEVYFVQCDDDKLPELSNILLELLPIDIPVVCESGSFAKYYSPGTHILIMNPDTNSTKLSYQYNLNKAQRVILTNEISTSYSKPSFSFSKKGWEI